MKYFKYLENNIMNTHYRPCPHPHSFLAPLALLMLDWPVPCGAVLGIPAPTHWVPGAPEP